MGDLYIRIYDISVENDFILSYKTGDTVGNQLNGFTLYTNDFVDGVYPEIFSEITLSGFSYDTQYWFKIEDTLNGSYIIENVRTSTEEYYELSCNSPTPTPTPTSGLAPTPTPTPGIVVYNQLLKCSNVDASYYIGPFTPGNEYEDGTALWGNIECNDDNAYVVIGTINAPLANQLTVYSESDNDPCKSCCYITAFNTETHNQTTYWKIWAIPESTVTLNFTFSGQLLKSISALNLAKATLDLTVFSDEYSAYSDCYSDELISSGATLTLSNIEVQIPASGKVGYTSVDIVTVAQLHNCNSIVESGWSLNGTITNINCANSGPTYDDNDYPQSITKVGSFNNVVGEVSC